MFQVSTKVRYGLRALINLAFRGNGRPVSIAVLSTDEGISRKYLEAIFKSLQKEGITRSVRGARGGHLLARPPERVTVFEVFAALEGPPSLLDCLEEGMSCKRMDRCSTKKFWEEMQACIVEFLKSRTLKDLMGYAGRSRRDGFWAMYI